MKDHKFRKFKSVCGEREFIIEEDLPDVGWYIYVFEKGKCIRDDLQDTLEIAKEVALEDYAVPVSSWTEVGE